MANEQILIVDDNEDIRNFVRTALEPEGYKIVEVADGTSALKKIDETEPDLIILDLSIGQPDGLEVCRSIRKHSTVPIIILTSHSDEMDEAMCLAIGADDFIAKPVSSRILVLRVATQIRHKQALRGQEGNLRTVGSLTLDVAARELNVKGNLVPLTKIEFDFVQLLMEEPKRVFTRNQIVEAIGASVDFSSDKLIDTHASRIRVKVRDAGGPHVLIAVRGVGFRMMSPESLME
ncbi:MAG TPA: response regulator transcription factor [Candidatus Nanopelagicaceae bacterium]